MVWERSNKPIEVGPLSEFIGFYFDQERKLTVILSKDAGRWHMSIAHPQRHPNWEEIKEARYRFIPDEVYMMLPLPPTRVYVNKHPHCFHLWEAEELKTKWIMDQG
jgi:hypothetical protein